MEQVIRKTYNSYGVIIAMFLFWGVVFWQIPLIHDAWAGQIYNNQGDFLQWIVNASRLYFSVNGRIISFIVVGFFERNEMMLDIANTIFMVLLIWGISKVVNVKKRTSNIIMLLTWALMLLASIDIRSEIYFYATMIYLIPCVLLIAFMWYVKNYDNISKLSNNEKYIVLCLLGVLNAGWIEHSGFAFVFILGVYWLVDLTKNRKINIKFTIFEFINGITFCVMMFSPGLRLNRDISSQISLVDTIVTNMGKSIESIIYDHKMIFLILSIVALIVVSQKTKIKKISYFSYQIFMIAFIIILLLNMIFEFWGINIPDILLMNADVETGYGWLWGIVGIVYIILLLRPILQCSNKDILLFSYLVGMFSLVPIIVTPNFGYRICFFAFVCIILIVTGLAADIEIKSEWLFWCLIGAVLFVQVDRYAIILANINDIQNEREELIESARMKQLNREWEFESTLILPKFSHDQLFMGASPQKFYDPIHHSVFLSFYKLDPNTLLVFSEDNNELRVSIENNNVNFTLIPENGSEGKQYIYYIVSGGQFIWGSEATSSTSMETELPNISGAYYFRCDILDENGNCVPVYAANLHEVQ